MSRAIATCLSLLLVTSSALADEPEAAPEKPMAGISIVGNDDAPKSLVIVPWKSSVLGATLDAPSGLDDGRGPVDRDVFARELDYYRIRTSSRGDASPAPH